MRRSTSLLFCASLVFVGACAQGNAASAVAPEMSFEPTDQSKCSVRRSADKPLIVEWPSADRAELEARAQSQVVVVRYDGCEMEVLSHCRAPIGYSYRAVSPKQDVVSMRNADELWANIPMGAAKFEAKLEAAGELTVAMTMVGRLEAERPHVSANELAGSCHGATHVVAALTVGAFEFFAGSAAQLGASVEVGQAGAGGRSAASRETLTRDGSPAACETAGPDAPPHQCSALLRVEVVRLGREPLAPSVACPEGGEWDGEQCVVHEVITQAQCPQGSTWDGEACVRPLAESQPARAAATTGVFDTLVGDVKAGEGWFCYYGKLDARPVARCERDKIDCGVELGKSISAGMTTDMERCKPRDTAVCFQAERSATEGLRTFCFPSVTGCESARSGVEQRTDVTSLSACRAYE